MLKPITILLRDFSPYFEAKKARFPLYYQNSEEVDSFRVREYAARFDPRQQSDVLTARTAFVSGRFRQIFAAHRDERLSCVRCGTVSGRRVSRYDDLLLGVAYLFNRAFECIEGSQADFGPGTTRCLRKLEKIGEQHSEHDAEHQYSRNMFPLRFQYTLLNII